jgi:hypothetical protein
VWSSKKFFEGISVLTGILLCSVSACADYIQAFDEKAAIEQLLRAGSYPNVQKAEIDKEKRDFRLWNSALLSCFIARVQLVPIRLFMALACPVLVSLAWFFVPRLPRLFRPLASGEDPWVGWRLFAAAAWSLPAVPVGLVAVLVFS